MKEFDLNIEKILENWEVFHAIREIIANALDEQLITNTKDIQIVHRSDGWHIIDYGRGINYHHLTQNENDEKLNNSGLIGRFGVGLKDALATLYRHNVKVTITSRYGVITLKQIPKAGFEDIVTLHAQIVPSPDENMVGTDFCLYGCTEEDIVAAKNLFMRFCGCEVLETTPFGQVINNNSKHSCIYVNGVRISEEPDFLFSYNITSMNAQLKKALNRERSNVGRSAYSERVKDILLSCSKQPVIRELIDDLQQFDKGELHDELRWKDISLYASQKMQEIDEKTTFVTADDLAENPDIIDEMKKEGYNPVVIPSNVADKIESYNKDAEESKKLTTINQYLKRLDDSFEPIIIEEKQLSEPEKNVYRYINRILSFIGGKPANVNSIEIAESLYNAEMRYDVVGLWDSSENRILIRRDQLENIEDFAGTLLHECAHASSEADDVSREFESELTNYLGRIVNAILHSHL